MNNLQGVQYEFSQCMTLQPIVVFKGLHCLNCWSSEKERGQSKKERGIQIRKLLMNTFKPFEANYPLSRQKVPVIVSFVKCEKYIVFSIVIIVLLVLFVGYMFYYLEAIGEDIKALKKEVASTRNFTFSQCLSF